MADKFRYWSIICYPESAPVDWISVLRDTGLPIAISPIHDRDLDLDGHIKKSHYHILVCFSGPTTYNNVLNISKLIGSEVCKQIYSVKGYYDYLVHKNEDDKYHYDENGIIHLNGFCVNNYCCMTPEEVQTLISDIDDDIMAFDLKEYAQLRLLYKYTNKDKYKFVNSHSILYKSLFQSIRGAGGITVVNNTVLSIINRNGLKILDDEIVTVLEGYND